MNSFFRIIKKYQTAYNLSLLLTFFFFAGSFLLLIFDLFFIGFSFLTSSNLFLYYFALALKIIFLVILIYLMNLLRLQWLNRAKAAKELDEKNNDKADTYQNALELYNNQEIDRDILAKIVAPAIEKAKNQSIQINRTKQKFAFTIFLILSFTAIVIGSFVPSLGKESLDYFVSFQIPEKEHKLVVDLEPGNVATKRNSDILIQVLEPEKEVKHHFFYRIDNLWREEALPNNEDLIILIILLTILCAHLMLFPIHFG